MRVAEISAATGVPEPYIVEAFFTSANPAADEEQVHTLLGEFRGTRKEFFRVDLQQALDVVYQVCGSQPRYCRAGLDYQTPDGRAATKAAVTAYISGWTTIYEENRLRRGMGGTLSVYPKETMRGFQVCVHIPKERVLKSEHRAFQSASGARPDFPPLSTVEHSLLIYDKLVLFI